MQVVEEAKMKSETLFLSVNYMDRLLSLIDMERDKLQLVGITSILVASKHEELAPQSVHNLVIMTDNSYQHKQVLDMERELLTALDYSLTALTPLRALEMLRLQAVDDGIFPSDADDAVFTVGGQSIVVGEIVAMSSFLLELSLLEFAEVR